MKLGREYLQKPEKGLLLREQNAEVQQSHGKARVKVSSYAGTNNKLSSYSSSEKASQEAKLRAERAAVERATSEGRKRALEKAVSQKII